MSEDYAIIRTQGKQHQIVAGQRLTVDRLPQEAGQDVTLGDVLLMRKGDQISVGTPTVAGAAVKAQVLRHLRGPKLIIFKKRPKKGYKKTNGHRQELTELVVKEIL